MNIFQVKVKVEMTGPLRLPPLGSELREALGMQGNDPVPASSLPVKVLAWKSHFDVCV